MKNLELFTETLKSSAVLAADQQKEIIGGYYTSYEDCAVECQGGTSGFPWPDPQVPSASGCYEERPGIWDCRDS